MTLTLDFEQFSIEFELDIQWVKQVRETSLDESGSEFIPGAVWLRVGETRSLVVDAFNTEDIAQFVEKLLKRSLDLPKTTLMPGLIQPGECCRWMHGYWQRIEDESVTPGDELNYDLLSALLFATGLGGRISIYAYGGRAIVEVATPNSVTSGQPFHGVWKTIDPATLVEKVRTLQKDIAASIR